MMSISPSPITFFSSKASAIHVVFTKAGKCLLCNQSANENVRFAHGAEKFFNLVCLKALCVTELNGWPSS